MICRTIGLFFSLFLIVIEEEDEEEDEEEEFKGGLGLVEPPFTFGSTIPRLEIPLLIPPSCDFFFHAFCFLILFLIFCCKVFLFFIETFANSTPYNLPIIWVSAHIF